MDTDRPGQDSQRGAQPVPPWRSLVVVGPSLLAGVYALVGTLARPGRMRRRLPRRVLAGGALLPWAYILIVRSRVDGRPRLLIKAFYVVLLAFPHFVMERGMLKGIRKRAVRGGR